MRRPITRLSRRDDDAGFVLPFVLLITMLLLAGTGTMLTVVSNNAVPAVQTLARQTALAAAQSGIQAYVAELDANCGTYSIAECQWPYNTATGTARTLTSGAYSSPTLPNAAYTVTATNSQGYLNHSSDDLRVLSTGCVPNCTSATSSVQLLADLSGTPNALRFAYFTNYESIDGTLLAKLYPARTIALDGPTATLVGATSTLAQVSGGTVTWPGVTTGALCNQTWLGSSGRNTNDDALEVGSTSLAGVTASMDHYCSVSFSRGMNFVGPVYSADQFLLSNGVPNATTGPSFSVPKQCSATVTTNCEPLPPASSPASPAYRSVATIGGAPATAGSVVTSTNTVTLPSTATDATPTCVFTPTSASTPAAVVFSGSTATVTNATLTSGSQCVSPFAVAHQTIEVLGNVTTQGTLNSSAGQVSLVALPNTSLSMAGDITITGDLTTAGALNTTTNQYGENAFGASSTAGAIDLVATHDVVLQHNVSCASTVKALLTATTAGFCPNDISGLYTTSQASEVINADGTLKATHPARQYCNSDSGTNAYPCTAGTGQTSSSGTSCDTSTATGRTVDAAIFALTGSFRTDNVNRGCALGVLNVVGGIYQNHRGPLGQEWEISSGSPLSVRPYSGYRLNLTYESLQYAGLPYVPALQGGTAAHPWVIIAVSSPTNASGS